MTTGQYCDSRGQSLGKNIGSFLKDMALIGISPALAADASASSRQEKEDKKSSNVAVASTAIWRQTSALNAAQVEGYEEIAINPPQATSTFAGLHTAKGSQDQRAAEGMFASGMVTEEDGHRFATYVVGAPKGNRYGGITMWADSGAATSQRVELYLRNPLYKPLNKQKQDKKEIVLAKKVQKKEEKKEKKEMEKKEKDAEYTPLGEVQGDGKVIAPDGSVFGRRASDGTVLAPDCDDVLYPNSEIRPDGTVVTRRAKNAPKWKETAATLGGVLVPIVGKAVGIRDAPPADLVRSQLRKSGYMHTMRGVPAEALIRQADGSVGFFVLRSPNRVGGGEEIKGKAAKKAADGLVLEVQALLVKHQEELAVAYATADAATLGWEKEAEERHVKYLKMKQAKELERVEKRAVAALHVLEPGSNVTGKNSKANGKNGKANGKNGKAHGKNGAANGKNGHGSPPPSPPPSPPVDLKSIKANVTGDVPVQPELAPTVAKSAELEMLEAQRQAGSARVGRQLVERVHQLQARYEAQAGKVQGILDTKMQVAAGTATNVGRQEVEQAQQEMEKLQAKAQKLTEVHGNALKRAQERAEGELVSIEEKYKEDVARLEAEGETWNPDPPEWVTGLLDPNPKAFGTLDGKWQRTLDADDEDAAKRWAFYVEVVAVRRVRRSKKKGGTCFTVKYKYDRGKPLKVADLVLVPMVVHRRLAVQYQRRRIDGWKHDEAMFELEQWCGLPSVWRGCRPFTGAYDPGRLKVAWLINWTILLMGLATMLWYWFTLRDTIKFNKVWRRPHSHQPPTRVSPPAPSTLVASPLASFSSTPPPPRAHLYLYLCRSSRPGRSTPSSCRWCPSAPR